MLFSLISSYLNSYRLTGNSDNTYFITYCYNFLHIFILDFIDWIFNKPSSVKCSLFWLRLTAFLNQSNLRLLHLGWDIHSNNGINFSEISLNFVTTKYAADCSNINSNFPQPRVDINNFINSTISTILNYMKL